MSFDTDKCIICKILDKEFAHKLLDGEVFMRPLFEFGSWDIKHKSNDETVNNNYRGDLFEGVVAVYGDVTKNPAFNGFPQNLLSVIETSVNIEASELQYFKIYSLYKLKYHDGHFVKPDNRIKQFGDYAVVFTDFHEFLRRLLKRIIGVNQDKCVFYFDKVKYFNESENKRLIPIFSKPDSYKWQNEMRIAYSRLIETKDKISGISKNMLDFDLNRQIFNIGDIRDIAYLINIDNLVNAKLPANKRYRLLYSKERNTTAELIIKDTRKALKDLKQLAIKPIFTI